MNGKTVKYLFEYPERSFSMLGSKGLLNWVPDKAYIKIQFRLDKGVWPDLRNPKTFNEKLQWLKLYDHYSGGQVCGAPVYCGQDR